MAKPEKLHIPESDINDSNAPIILDELIKKFVSMREFSRVIGEHCADVTRWRKGKTKIKARAVISICRRFPQVRPAQLNSCIFPADLLLTFEIPLKEFESNFKVI